ncbi:MAG: gliding motility-associated C-terminal domain-containing protein [Bacteroidetes bacterium]|nr:gliding motility-associated C-terminal domain-containing protein [Bacteroidota bacterium]
MKARFILLIAAILFGTLSAQVKPQLESFDREKAKEQAIKNGMNQDDIEGYLFALEREFIAQQEMKNKLPVDPYAWNAKGNNPVIQGAGCVNASFENSNFGNWTGSIGNSNTCGPAGSQSPNYTQTGGTIVSPGGNNAGLTNAANYHTVMNIPPTNPVYPTCNQFGYDSIAVRVVGTQTVSDIPHVSPFYPDGNSVRMNGAIANYRACKLRYNFALTPFNRNITYAFALVFYGAHAANQQPYFKVSVLDQNNNPIGGTCGVYNVNGSQAATDTSFKYSALLGGNQILYRKWRQYGVDLSSPIYATVTAVNLEFTVGGCCYGGHWGYAYVDAECSQGGTYSAMCAGTNTAVLTAPLGYVAYQWYQLPGMTPMSPLVGGNTPSLTVNPAIVGQVFQVKMTTPTGCTISLNDTVKISGVQITAMNSSPTCPGGSSGSATVSVQGSNVGYNYTWVNAANTVVSTTNTAQNLPPGIYTVSVTAVSCGVATSTVAVGVAPPTYYQYNQNFCGNLAIITATTGTGYVWYNSAGQIASAAGSQSLVVNGPVNNAVYTVVYTTPQGCKDSVRYTLKQIAGGSIYISNIKDICPTSPPVAYAVVNLNTTQIGPYSYTVTNGTFNQTLLNTTSIKDSVSGLAIGTYSVAVFDGACFYNTTFTISPYNYSYTVTPTNSVLCVSGNVPMGVSLSNTTAPVCGGAITAACSNPKILSVGSGSLTNTQYSFPSVYGGYYDVCRHQLLFTAADLTAAGIQPGSIPSMQFFVKSMLPIGLNTQSYIGTLQGFTIKMKCTNLTVLNNVWDNVGFTQVLNPANYSPTTGWNNHTFNTPFNWDGVSSILVDICFNWVSSNPYTSNPLMPYTNTGVAKTRYYYSSSQNLCGLNTTCFTTVNRPNVRFGNCPITKTTDFTYLWTPNVALTSTTTQSTVASPTASTVYSITVNPVGQVNCAQTQSVDIQVIVPVTPTITSGAFCTNFPPTVINVTPTTGTWTPTAYMSGTGVFTPSLAAVGGNTVAYTTGTGTCSAASTLTINVEQYNPATLTGSVTPLCISDPTVNLMGIVANTTGTWTGTGVNAGVFDPALSGAGTYVITYNTNSVPTLTLCPDVSTLQVNVHTIPQPTITQVGPYCNNMAPVQLLVSPTGGVYSGIGNNAVSPSGLFDPQIAVIGANTISYTVSSGPCVKTTSIDINVEKFIPATLTSSVGPFCWNASAVNLNSSVMTPGGTWSGAGVANNTFDPSASGSGNFVLTYNTNSSPTASLCPDVSTVAVLVNPMPIVSITTNTLEGCRPLKIEFNVPSVNGGTGTWTFGDNSTTTGISAIHTYTTAGTFMATFNYYDNIGCNVFTQVPPIIVRDLPIADFKILPDNQISIADPTVEFINTSTVLQNNTYFWNIGDFMHSSNTNTSFTFGTHGFMYITLVATNEFGCKDTAVKVVEVKNDYGLWVPNAFTPNGDGLNDVFRVVVSPFGLDLSDFEMDIFDRWGEKIFSTKDILVGWNGAKFNKGDVIKDDTYVYKIKYTTSQKEAKYKTGHVTLIK